MKIQPGTAAMTIVLGLLTAMGPLSTDMYLPSLPGITASLDTNEAAVQLTLSIFLVGFALGQIVYGPLSDQYGRRPILLGGLVAFVAASLGCMLADTIEQLILARFAQAVAACAAIVVARAIVRDLYQAEEAARMLSLMGALMGIVPTIAPILGGVLEALFGWRSVFAVIAGLAALLAILVAAGLSETLALANRQPATFAGMLRSFGILARHRGFRRYVAIICFCYSGLFAFISGSSFVLQDFYGLSPKQFGLAFAGAVMGYIAGTLLGARLTTRIGIRPTILAGCFLLATGGVAMAILVQASEPRVWHVIAPMVFYMAGVGLTLPQCMAGAITPFPERAGAASSLMGFLQMTSGAAVGVAVGHTITHGPSVLAAAIAIMGVSALGAALLNTRSAAGPASRQR